MQTTSSQYDQLSEKPVRQIGYNFRASFDKVFDNSITFFTLDTSVLDGNDLLAPEGGNVLTEWDKYLYTSYDSRVISIEWTREFSFLYSITAAIADIELNNYDGLFTRGAGGPLNSYLLPRRPIRLLSGFESQVLPQFVGLTESAPIIDRVDRTARVHAQDFLRFIFDRNLDQTVMYQDMRVDEILRALFNAVGVLDSQMDLDTARTTVPFAYFEKDTTYGNAVENLMKAEMGSLYMDESGLIVFRSRLRLSSASVLTLDDNNIINYETSNESEIINSVRVRAQVRSVQPLQTIYSSVEPITLAASGETSVFLQLEDPVTSIDDIDGYIANSAADGSGSDVTSDVTVSSATLFSTSIKVTFDNAGTSTAFITTLNVLGTPARVVKIVDVIEKDQTSIDDFEEQPLEIESPYIQDEDNATSIALTIIQHFKDYGSTIIATVKAIPELQITDKVSVLVDGIDADYIVRKIENVISPSSGHRQKLTLQKYNIPAYFILDQSLLNGGDVLAP